MRKYLPALVAGILAMAYVMTVTVLYYAIPEHYQEGLIASAFAALLIGGLAALVISDNS